MSKDNIINFPTRTGYDDFIDEGFSPEVAAVASVLCDEIDVLRESRPFYTYLSNEVGKPHLTVTPLVQ